VNRRDIIEAALQTNTGPPWLSPQQPPGRAAKWRVGHRWGVLLARYAVAPRWCVISEKCGHSADTTFSRTAKGRADFPANPLILVVPTPGLEPGRGFLPYGF
jgi:hypothetical protein